MEDYLYLRSAKDRKDAIVGDWPNTKIYFESQKFSDVPADKRPKANNEVPLIGIGLQSHAFGQKQVRDNNDLIEAAAARYGVDPDIVRAIIYTEGARGHYGQYVESFDRSTHQKLPLPEGQFEVAKTLFPGNISAEWEALIPGSNVHRRADNIELTAKLIARIARRLDDPSIENIYSLYNSLSHDRTYQNKETKSTPYFAKQALEARAWEKKDWSAPELPAPAASAPSPMLDSLPPVLRELFKGKRSMAPDAAGVDLAGFMPAFRPGAGEVAEQAASADRHFAGLPTSPQEASIAAVPDRQSYLSGEASGGSGSPVRYLSRRVVGGPDSNLDSPPLVPSDHLLFSGQSALRNARFGNGAPGSTTETEPEQATTLPGLVSGKPMDHSLKPWMPGFPHTLAPEDEDWLMQLLAPRRG